MNLYQNKNKILREIKPSQFSYEKDIQKIVENNIQEIFGYDLVRSEFPLKNIRIDSLCFDNEAKSFVIIEYKKGTDHSLIDQGFTYLSTITNNKADCVMEYNERFNSNLKRNDIEWDSLKVVFISSQFTTFQKGSVNFQDMDFFELWEINQFENSIVSMNQIKSNSKESIKKLASSNKVIKNVTSELKNYTETEWIKDANNKNKELWFSFREKLGKFEQGNFNTKKHYISFRKGNKAVCYFNIRKSGFRIDIIRGNIYLDGRKSKSFFNIDDPKNICKESHLTWKNGDQRHDYSFTLNAIDQIDYVEFLINQKYKSM